MGNQNLFSRPKKSFFKQKLFYFILAGVLAFGYFINQMPETLLPSDDNPANVNQPVGQSGNTDKSNSNNTSSNTAIANSNDNLEKNDVIPSDNEYYLVKEIDGIIKLFHYDETGLERLIRDTDISYSLISENDQALFSEGIIIQTEDELLDLLQDFES